MTTVVIEDRELTVADAEASQDKSCWTHELQLTPFATKPSF